MEWERGLSPIQAQPHKATTCIFNHYPGILAAKMPSRNARIQNRCSVIRCRYLPLVSDSVTRVGMPRRTHAKYLTESQAHEENRRDFEKLTSDS